MRCEIKVPPCKLETKMKENSCNNYEWIILELSWYNYLNLN